MTDRRENIACPQARSEIDSSCRYVAYYRVSTGRQGSFGFSVEAQRAAVKDYLASNPGGDRLSRNAPLRDMRVACGAGAIRVFQGQRSGKTIMSGRELMRGAKLAPGVVFTQSHGPSSVPQA